MFEALDPLMRGTAKSADSLLTTTDSSKLRFPEMHGS
jgi:hypothetical protein